MNVTLNVSVLLCAENKLWAPRTDSGALGTQGHGRGAGDRRLGLGSVRASTAAAGLLPGGAGVPDVDPLSSARSGVCFVGNQHKDDIQGCEQKPNLYLKYIFVISAS